MPRVLKLNTLRTLLDSPYHTSIDSGYNESVLDTYGLMSRIALIIGKYFIFVFKVLIRFELFRFTANSLQYNHSLEKLLKDTSYLDNPFELCAELCKFVYLTPHFDYIDRITEVNKNLIIHSDSSDIFLDRDMRILCLKYQHSLDKIDFIIVVKGTTPSSSSNWATNNGSYVTNMELGNAHPDVMLNIKRYKIIFTLEEKYRSRSSYGPYREIIDELKNNKWMFPQHMHPNIDHPTNEKLKRWHSIITKTPLLSKIEKAEMLDENCVSWGEIPCVSNGVQSLVTQSTESGDVSPFSYLMDQFITCIANQRSRINKVIVTGHSLGGASAMLIGVMSLMIFYYDTRMIEKFDWKLCDTNIENHDNDDNDDTDSGFHKMISPSAIAFEWDIIIFAGPNVGDENFTELVNFCRKYTPLRVFQFYTKYDVIPRLPLKSMLYPYNYDSKQTACNCSKKTITNGIPLSITDIPYFMFYGAKYHQIGFYSDQIVSNKEFRDIAQTYMKKEDSYKNSVIQVFDYSSLAAAYSLITAVPSIPYDIYNWINAWHQNFTSTWTTGSEYP